MSFLEDLAPELYLMIFEELDSPQTLYNLLRASPSAYKLFPPFLQRLSSRLQGALVRESFEMARICLEFNRAEHRRDQPVSPDVRPTTMWLEYTWDIWDRCSDIYREPEVTQLGPGYFVALQRLSDTLGIQLFISDFVARALEPGYSRRSGFPLWAHPSYFSNEPELEGACNIYISPTEQCRLQRAFYRMSFHSQIVRRRSPNETAESNPAKVSLLELEGWEVEEIMCVFYYVHSIWASLVSMVKGRFLRDPEKLRRYCDRMSSFGLAFLRRVLQSDAETARDVIRKTYLVEEDPGSEAGEPNLMFDAYYWHKHMPQLHHIIVTQERSPQSPWRGDEPPLKRTAAWHDSTVEPGGQIVCEENLDYLRGVGWVFWDSERFSGLDAMLDGQPAFAEGRRADENSESTTHRVWPDDDKSLSPDCVACLFERVKWLFPDLVDDRLEITTGSWTVREGTRRSPPQRNSFLLLQD
ncbi:hypothetical protein F4778DRAFT_786499 [Xylariomycetidae sp. FL2044]|nr:hypothetical protein F4778DRAFT_786499 [Xylariomycetidae sp. FL2044]